MTARPHDFVERFVTLAGEGRTNVQIAAEFGVSKRLLERCRRDNPDLSARIIAARAARREARRAPHGTRARYDGGCRCDDCRGANREKHRQIRAAKRAREGLPPVDPNWRKRKRDETPQPDLTLVDASHRVRIRVGSETVRAIEQLIARGEATVIIMERLDVSYAAVKTVRDGMAKAAESAA